MTIRSGVAMFWLLVELASSTAVLAQALPPFAPPSDPPRQASPAPPPPRRPDVVGDMARPPVQQPPQARPAAPPPAYGVPAPAAAADGTAPPQPLPAPRRSSVPLGEIQRAWDTAVASPGQTAPGRLRVSYQPGVTAQVRTRQYMVTPIHLPACETIEDVFVGDAGAFEVSRPPGRQNVVLVAPNFVEVDTNLQVISNAGRVYSFYLRSDAVSSDAIPDILVEVEVANACRRDALRDDPAGPRGIARSAGSQRQALAPQAAGRGRDYLRETPLDAAKLRFDGFGIFVGEESHKDIAPDRVFTDGIWTYLDYGDRAGTVTWPVASLVTEGVDMPVNTRVLGDRDQILVVEAVGDITLASGRKTVCIRDRLARGPQRPALRAGAAGAVVDGNLGRGFASR